MKAFKIDVNAGDIFEIEYNGKLKTAQTHVEGLIDFFFWPDFNSDVIINDEGNYCFDENKGLWAAKGFSYPINGNALIVGLPDLQGNSTSCKADLSKLKELISILPTRQVAQ